jgi:hypothetical protein
MKYYAMKPWGRGGIAPSFLASALDLGEWATSHSGHFDHEKGSLYRLDGRLGEPQSRSPNYPYKKEKEPSLEL